MARPIRPHDAEAIAIGVLGLIAADQAHLDRFLGATGVDPGDLRQAAADPAFLRGVMAYVIGDEALLVEAAAAAGLKPEAMMQAAMALGAVWESDTP